jgi:hypothetical protein
MRTRQGLLVLALLLTPAAARADRHNWEANASASAASGSQLWGGNLALARTIHIKDSHKLSAFADFSKHGGAHDDASLTQTSAQIGLRRVMFRTLNKHPLLPAALVPMVKEHPEYHYRLQLFVQAAAGVVNTSAQGTHGAWLGGVGLDGLFSDYGGVRAQVDYIGFRPESGRDHYFRFSLGVMYRFEHEYPKSPKTPKAP